jgi:hypothetical protein
MSYPLLVLAQATTETGGVSRWLVGAGVLLLLIVLVTAVAAFGGGREHS